MVAHMVARERHIGLEGSRGGVLDKEGHLVGSEKHRREELREKGPMRQGYM